MTFAEYLQNKIDDCTKTALSFLKKGDEKMVNFWLSARNGFTEKLHNLTLEKASQEFSE